MKKQIIILSFFLALTLVFAGCLNLQKQEQSEDIERGYLQVDAEKAKSMMDTETEYIILDVRTDEEYAEGHIPNSILIPDFELRERAEIELTDKDQLIFVYCRSGNRSKNSSAILVELGYTNVVDFGGIRNWPYDIEK